MGKSSDKLMIGIVGPLACGKGEVAEYLRGHFGFVSFTLSHLVHEELDKRGMKDYTRKDLQDVGNDLREQFGDQVLAERAIEKLKKDGVPLIIIEGIRNPGEVKYLKKQKNFYLISVDADAKVRYARLTYRNKPWDPKNWKEFMKISRRDLGKSEGKSGQQVRKCMDKADFHIRNDKDLAHLYSKMENIMFQVKRRNKVARKLLSFKV
jgi:dephospho-CoA kinase